MKPILKIRKPDRLSNFLFYISVLTFLIAFGFAHNQGGGWREQFLPDLNGGSIVDITFTDSLTGYAVTSADTDQKSYIIKTSNGGENWLIIKSDSANGPYTKCKFINAETGYASMLDDKLYKTTDGGNNWIQTNNPNSFTGYQDISVLSENEVWMCFDSPFTGGVYRSTDCGISWQNKYPPQLSNGPDRIYMINPRIGFISNGNHTSSYVRKTTDMGTSWFDIPAPGGWEDIYFKDSLTGWRCRIGSQNLIKTTDGGSTWENLLTPIIGNPNLIIKKFKIINPDVIWGVYSSSYILFPNNEIRGVILKSTNSGLNWGYQLPDTSIRALYYFINFSDSLNGWSYDYRNTGVHTLTGGDTVTYPLTSISNNNIIIPTEIKLYQNYPNPFNPETKIKYNIRKNGFIKLNVYDISGKKVKEIVNKRQSAGEYEVVFNAGNLPSGVYFYTLSYDSRFTETRKMILIR
ncbi:MAG TPA: T9SS type A sorting domain-containing protein [Ignavibacteria bacterium]|nr:hypothetical protein [Bacteroidota bacterium]HRI84254.1 T9SS type A sorting domain-containing protein [Ignavibacteria bacterium]HRJ98595.1 T9SS type A sorting domain-containing protein [Ignavibacteria bacterium]